MGASDTVGVGARHPASEAWPTVFHRRTLGRSAAYVNVGVSGSTTSEALRRQLPRALAADPQLATVWLNVNDLVRLTPVPDYERDLGALVRQLRRGGRTEVLLAATPPVEGMPAVSACFPGAPAGTRCALPVRLPGPEPVIAVVRMYNEAIARVAEREGAVLVDLHAAGLAAREAGTEASCYSADGFHPSTEGHAALAGVFAAALRSAPFGDRFAAPA